MNDKQVRAQLEKILRLRAQYRAAKQEAKRINKLAGGELKRLENLQRKGT